MMYVHRTSCKNWIGNVTFSLMERMTAFQQGIWNFEFSFIFKHLTETRTRKYSRIFVHKLIKIEALVLVVQCVTRDVLNLNSYNLCMLMSEIKF